MTAPSRRAVFGGIAALAAGGAVAPAIGAAHPDAELIEASAEMHRLQVVCERWNANEISDAAGNAANDRLWTVLQLVIATPARTAAGVRAKASALEVAIRALNGDSLLEADTELALSLARDVAGMAA